MTSAGRLSFCRHIAVVGTISNQAASRQAQPPGGHSALMVHSCGPCSSSGVHIAPQRQSVQPSSWWIVAARLQHIIAGTHSKQSSRPMTRRSTCLSLHKHTHTMQRQGRLHTGFKPEPLTLARNLV